MDIADILLYIQGLELDFDAPFRLLPTQDIV